MSCLDTEIPIGQMYLLKRANALYIRKIAFRYAVLSLDGTYKDSVHRSTQFNSPDS